MRVFLIVFLLAFTGLAHADDKATRAEFKKALSAARQGNLGRHAGLSSLKDYPLYPYLEAEQLRAELRRHADDALDGRIASFVQDHADLPPTKRLRAAWLASLEKRGNWQSIIDNTHRDDGAYTRCRAVHARIKLHQMPIRQARELYNVGHSQPASCDAVFDWLKNNDHLSARLIKQRAHKAIVEGQTGLARYLSRQAPVDVTATIERWVKLMAQPERLRDSPSSLDGDVATEAFKQWALNDLDTAARQLPTLFKRLHLDAKHKHQMARHVALLYAQDHRPEALLWFSRLDHRRMKDDDHALGWEARAAIYQKRWPLVRNTINRMPQKMANKEIWQYWKARALARTGQQRSARRLLSRLARQRSYHGYLAADALNQDYHFNERPVPDDHSARQRLKARPALARAYEARALDMKNDAYREWQTLTDDLGQAELAQAARYAAKWGWHAQAITTLAEADYWDDLAIRYPTPYLTEVEKAADANDLETAHVMALMRTESLFRADAGSSAGARGLMQLMPGTAGQLATTMGVAAPSKQALLDPDTNIRFGTRYLHDMMIDWSDNIALATASYNAGPGKIDQWLPDETMPADIWIANIPYTETREYVENIMSHMTVFQHRLDQSVTPLKDRIDDVRPAYPDSDHTTF